MNALFNHRKGEDGIKLAEEDELTIVSNFITGEKILDNHTAKNVIDYTVFEHPIFNMQTLKAQKLLGSIQGRFNTFYCGSYCGYGFHEDGIQSAAFIAKKLQIKLPWQRNDNFKFRLDY